jgi:hypothetical protein
MKLNWPTIVVVWLVGASVALADIDAVKQLGLRPNDVSFDNGKVITDNVAAGRIKDTLHFPGGIYFHSTPIVLARDSLALTGQGMSRWRRAGAFENTSAVIFVYLGPADQPAWKISGDGITLRGINIWRDFYGAGSTGQGAGSRAQGAGNELLLQPESARRRGTPEPTSGTIGIEWTDWGRRDVSACTFAGWDIAWRFAPSNHNDCSTVTHVGFSGCRVCVRGEESQSTAIDWRGIYIHGAGEVVLDLSKGGNYNFDTVAINEPRLLLRLRETSSNTCTYSFTNLKVDNNAAGWRLVQMDKPGPLNLHVRGHIGQRAKMGDAPISLRRPNTRVFKPPADYQVLDIELWGPNPTDSALWRPTLQDVQQPAR